MKTAFIYALRCPVTGQIRYIGKSVNPRTRRNDHNSATPKGRNHRTNWLRSLTKQGLKPTFERLAEVSDDTWKFWERSYIHLYRSLGFDLVNSTDGGEGGNKHSEATKQKMSIARKGSGLGKVHSPEARQNMSRAHRNKKCANNTSGFVGVCKTNGPFRKWRASINVAAKQIFLGNFPKLEDAVFVRALAYDKYYGNKH